MKNETLDDDSDIYTFICKLRQEKLFIKSEKLDIQELNELIRAKTQTVIKASWLTNKQKLLLFERRVSSQNCQRFDFVRNSEFVEAKNTLGFQVCLVWPSIYHRIDGVLFAEFRENFQSAAHPALPAQAAGQLADHRRSC